LINSSEAVRARQFDAAETELQGNTTELLEQYERIASQSASEDDDAVVEELNLTVQQQRELVDEARNARKNYSDYQVAVANGNETRAREIARTLLREAEEGNQTAQELQEQYERLSNRTDINISGPTAHLDTAQARLTELRERVREDTLVATNLTINSTATASPVDPLRIRGRVLANNTGLSNGTIELTVGGRTVQGDITGNGTFSAAFRPVTLSPGQRTASLQYIPDQASPYEGARISTTVRIKSLSPQLTVESNSSRVQFGDELAVGGRVTLNQTAISGIPIQLRLDGRAIDTARTNETGQFSVGDSLPATIPNGTQQVTIVVSRQNASVRRITQTRAFQIDPTETSLNLTATQLNQTAIRVTGQLTTTDGAPLASRPLAISVGNDESVVIRTDQAGRINATLPTPDNLAPSELPFVAQQLSITGEYAASGTSLTAATATATVQYTPPRSQSLRRIGIAALILVGLTGTVTVWRRRRIGSLQTNDADSAATGTGVSDPQSGSITQTPATLLQQARGRRNTGRPDAAVRLTYAALRRKYVAAFDFSPALTHWELYRAAETELEPAAHELLYDVTAAFERAVYTENAEIVPGSKVETLIERVATELDDHNRE
jgi:hypothetical protein